MQHLLIEASKFYGQWLNRSATAGRDPYFCSVYGMELVSEVTLCQNGMSLECQYSIEVD